MRGMDYGVMVGDFRDDDWEGIFKAFVYEHCKRLA